MRLNSILAKGWGTYRIHGDLCHGEYMSYSGTGTADVGEGGETWKRNKLGPSYLKIILRFIEVLYKSLLKRHSPPHRKLNSSVPSSLA